MDDEKILMRYYLFTIPHITVIAGALLGILLVVGLDMRRALGIFSAVYGMLLIIIGLMARPHFSKLVLYKISILFFSGILIAGIIIFFLG